MAFSSIEVALNGVDISPPCYNYPYKVLMNYAATKSKSEEESFLTSALCYPDTDSTLTDTNLGFKKRKELSALSKSFEMIGSIKTSLFLQSKFLIPNSHLQLKLTKSRPEFSLIGTGGPLDVYCPYKVDFEEVNLVLKVLEVNNEIIEMHKSMLLNNKRARYPFYEPRIFVSQIKSGTLTHLSDQIICGRLPSYLTIGFVDAINYQGHWNKSAAAFGNHNVNSLTIKTDHPLIKYEYLKVDFDNNLYLKAYRHLEDAMSNTRYGINLSRDSFKKSPIFVFQIIPTATSSLSPDMRGIVRVSKLK